jgi:hypothetical protein
LKRCWKTPRTRMSADRRGALSFFGDTSGGRHLMVVCEEVADDTAYPVTAYEVPRKQGS